MLRETIYGIICFASKPVTFAWIGRQLENDGENHSDVAISNALQSLVEEGYIRKEYQGEVLVYSEIDLDQAP
ncbi:hypothetical protein J41TS12_41790 [Paenibacillus antibioticophila]|uniref:Uncharacterized protein n=1 Tax=Paenibacillus antibioticophila TaxID=1274374 RepID=A0A920CJL7_9BACL|nr:hypothetical protein [Paenibacillus antibioticophila]GIO39057.1 hypothetical protein J41TS12_39180 [Paenibacillus antibioticophila]GIO39318.1 hypothetical protein J41TS12_41790 [Paenibacillus antibioticophila]